MSTFRASDADREQVAERLRADLLEGRLTVEDYESRVAHVYRASTVEELEELVADLPDRYRPMEKKPRRPLFGSRAFTLRIESSDPPAVAISEVLRVIAPHLLRYGYRVERPHESQLLFTHQERPAWTILASIFLFPFGLVALLHQKSSHVLVNAIAVEGQTLLDCAGVAPAGVLRVLLDLEL